MGDDAIVNFGNKRGNPEYLLVLMSVAASIAFSVWQALLNNFAIEQAAFTGREIGILQSLREIPGFLAFTAVFVLLVLKEQTFALLSVALLGVGVAMTGFLPSEYGLYFTTVLMSIGFHYFYTVQQSLTLQWIDIVHAPLVMGRLSAASSVAALVAFGSVWLGMEYLDASYRWLYFVAGGVGQQDAAAQRIDCETERALRDGHVAPGGDGGRRRLSLPYVRADIGEAEGTRPPH